MSDIKQKIVDGNRSVIENSSEKRATAKVDSQGAAYSQKDLVTVVKAIDTAVNKTKVEGVVTDSFFEMVGDKDNHFIAVIHTGMVIKRQEEGLPVNPNAKQFSPDSLPTSLQQMLGYGYYPITSRTKKQEETEAALARHLQSQEIVVTDARNGSIGFSKEVMERFNAGNPPRMSRAIIYAIQNAVYAVSHEKGNWVFLKKGFPKEIADCYIGFVASENSTQEQLIKGFAKADTKAKVDAKNRGFNILFGRKIVEATYHMRNPDGTPLIDPTNWFKENPIERKELESTLFGEEVWQNYSNKKGHSVRLVLVDGKVEVRSNFQIPLLGRSVSNVEKVIRIDPVVGENTVIASSVIKPGFEKFKSQEELFMLNFFNGIAKSLDATISKEDAKAIAKMVDEKFDEEFEKVSAATTLSSFLPKSVRFIHFPSGAVNVIVGGGFTDASYPKYNPKHPTGAETALPAEFCPLYKMEASKVGPLELESLKLKVYNHFIGLTPLPQITEAITVQIFTEDAGKGSKDDNAKLRAIKDGDKSAIAFGENLICVSSGSGAMEKAREIISFFENGWNTRIDKSIPGEERIVIKKIDPGLMAEFLFEARLQPVGTIKSLADIKNEAINKYNTDEIHRLMNNTKEILAGIELAKAFMAFGEEYSFLPADSQEDSPKGFQEKYNKADKGVIKAASLVLVKEDESITMTYSPSASIPLTYEYAWGNADLEGRDGASLEWLKGKFELHMKRDADYVSSAQSQAEVILHNAKKEGIIKEYTIGEVKITTGMKKRNPDIGDVLVKTDVSIVENGGTSRMSPFTMGRWDTIQLAVDSFVMEVQSVVNEARARLDKNGVRRISSLDELE